MDPQASGSDGALGPFTVGVAVSSPLNWAAAAHQLYALDCIEVGNEGATVVRGLTVEIACAPPYLAPATLALEPLNPGQLVSLRELALQPDLARLKELVEAEHASLSVRLLHRGQEVAAARAPLAVLACNEWDRTIRRDLIAAFVMPNHPAITELVADAREVQEQQFGRPEFDGYQSGTAERVKQQAAAVYGAIQRRGITYLGLPASFEERSQKVRFPDALRHEKQGNCIEVAAWYAAALEACGLRAVLVMLRGHAFSGFWLTEQGHSLDPIETDAATVRKLAGASAGMGALVLVETTAATARPAISFAQACEAALAKITDADYQEMVDVAGARRLGIKPLNVAVGDAMAASAGSPVARPDLTLPATAPSPADSAPGTRRITNRVEGWIDTLMDLTLRNELIGGTMSEDPAAWAGLRPRRGVVLAVPDLAAFENDLADGVAFKLATDSPAPPPPADRSAHSAFLEALGAAQRRRSVVCDPGGKAVPERIRTLWKKHRQGVEEKGISALHAALGYVRWFESDASAQPRYAPLLLVPAHLERVSVGGDFVLQAAEGETVLNSALVQKLRRDFDVDLSGLASNLPGDDYGIDVAAVFAEVSSALLRLRRFEVVAIATLGLFDYRKQVMARDLKEIFASGQFAPNDFLALLEPKLAGERLNRCADSDRAATFADPRQLDALIHPSDLPLVVDCDSSQLSAVQAAMDGQSFVLQGPPGTGKSQTISNMIACLLAAGKRVLFVAEKRAALSVVAARLARVGLDSACLELHSEKADPGQVSASLVAALDGERGGEEVDFERWAGQVDEVRTVLNAFVTELHAPTPLGLSFFAASARRHALRSISAPTVEHADILETSRETFDARLRALEALEAAIKDCGGWAGHPFVASRLASWSERRVEAVRQALLALQRTAAQAATALDESAAAVGLDATIAKAAPDTLVDLLALLAEAPPPWVRGLAAQPDRDDYLTVLADLFTVAARRESALTNLAERWRPGLYDLDLRALVAQIRAAQGRWMLARWWGMRGPRAALRGVAIGAVGATEHLIEDVDLAVAVRADAESLDEAPPAIAGIMGPAFAGSRTPASTFERAQAVTRWAELIQRLKVAGREAGVSLSDLAMPVLDAGEAATVAANLRAALTAVRAAAEQAAEVLALDRPQAFGTDDAAIRLAETGRFATAALADLPRLRDKTASEAAATTAERVGLAPFLASVRTGALPETDLARTYEVAFLTAWVAETSETCPQLGQFRGRQHDRVVEAFRRADRALLAAGRGRARREVFSRRPTVNAAAHAQSEVGILRREAARRRRRMPVRRLLAELPTLVPRLKPCLLMSPLAVAHFLPVDCEKFDAVIFDEASQVRTADAVGALWRGQQVIVVGDSKQMPPTDFFSGGGADDDAPEGVPEDAESVLDEACVSGVPPLMLKWHYRSRDERLIAFSNHNYYENRLLTFPAADPGAEGCGLDFRRVPGVFDRGASRRNEIEARTVAELVVERLRDPVRRDRSIGIVTFNAQQQDLIETMLDAKRLEHPEIEPYFGATAEEPVFVKNLENVQGDERDVMMFSTTFGRDVAGKTSLNFGPINRDGGERRLNVAITRARERLVVVTSMDPEEIDLSRTASTGVRHLRDFLRYARDGERALHNVVNVSAGAACESPFEEDVLAACEGLGWRMDRQVGCSGYRIDLAVRDPNLPGRHVLGIECDGATYHSAATARDRDRLRQAVLENLGWTLHRIWSTDWRVARDAEIERLRIAYTAALGKPRQVAGRGANHELREDVAVSAIKTEPPSAPAAVRAAASAPMPSTPSESIDPSMVTDAMRREAILATLCDSGAMPPDALIRTAANRVGHLRVGSRIKSAFDVVLRRLVADGEVRMLGERIAPNP